MEHLHEYWIHYTISNAIALMHVLLA